MPYQIEMPRVEKDEFGDPTLVIAPEYTKEQLEKASREDLIKIIHILFPIEFSNANMGPRPKPENYPNKDLIKAILKHDPDIITHYDPNLVY